MAKQLLIDAYRGKRTRKAPWVPYSGVHGAFLIGEPADKYLRDPGLLAKGVVEAASRYKADGIPLSFDLSVEADSMGCGIKWWPDNVPNVTTHPCAQCTVEEAGLEIPGPEDGRWPVIVEAAKLAKPQLEEMDCAMLGLLCGPLTLAAHLKGVKILNDVYKDKASAHDVCRFAGLVGARSAEIYRDIGCDVICIVDPVASQINEQAFKDYVAVNVQPAVKVIHDAGLTSCFFVCGDCTKILHSVAQIGTHAFAVDEQLNLTYVRDVALKHGVGFGGNLKLTLALSLGLVSPREDTLINLAAGGATGFVLAPGCDMPFDVPMEHMNQVLSARDWFEEYYAPYPKGARV